MDSAIHCRGYPTAGKEERRNDGEDREEERQRGGDGKKNTWIGIELNECTYNHIYNMHILCVHRYI